VHAGDTLYPMLEISALTPQRTTGVVTLAATMSWCSRASRRSCCAGATPWMRLPERREKNRLGREGRPDRRQHPPNQRLGKAITGPLREGSEGGRSASEGANRESLTDHGAPSSLLCCDR